MFKITNYERYNLVKSGINKEAIMKIVNDHFNEASEYVEKYGRYRIDDAHVPIFSRVLPKGTINKKVNNDFFSDIIDNKVGYMLGNPLTYQSLENDDRIKSLLTDFTLRNNTDDLDAELLKMGSICGVAYRLCYFNLDGFAAIKNLAPWEVILIEDVTEQPFIAIRYYALSVDDIQVDVYDRQYRYHYIIKNTTTDDKKTTIIEEQIDRNGLTQIPHMFGEVPIVRFRNNDEEQGDCDKVLELIDAYDEIFSDVSGEISQFRLAYLALFGAKFTTEDLDKIKETGAVSMPLNSDAKFLTKNLDDAVIEHYLNRSENNIKHFAKAVDFNDPEFGVATGVALRYKLLPLENKSKFCERKFSTTLRQQFKVLATAWSAIMPIDYLAIKWTFKRNIPVDLLSEADATNKLKGYVSEKTRLAQLSIVTDVEQEIEDMDKDMEKFVDVSAGTDATVESETDTEAAKETTTKTEEGDIKDGDVVEE